MVANGGKGRLKLLPQFSGDDDMHRHPRDCADAGVMDGKMKDSVRLHRRNSSGHND